MNSRQKGARGERMWRDQLRENGWEARRGQQFAGGTDSPDVVCPKTAHRVHYEVKVGNNISMRKALEQAIRDAKPGQIPVVAHKRDYYRWTVTIPNEHAHQLIGQFYVPRHERVWAKNTGTTLIVSNGEVTEAITQRGAVVDLLLDGKKRCLGALNSNAYHVRRYAEAIVGTSMLAPTWFQFLSDYMSPALNNNQQEERNDTAS